jgi:transposase
LPHASDSTDAEWVIIDDQTVKTIESAAGFVVLHKRWIVERTVAWLNRCRRLAKDWEATIASSEAWLLIASIRRAVRIGARS